MGSDSTNIQSVTLQKIIMFIRVLSLSTYQIAHFISVLRMATFGMHHEPDESSPHPHNCSLT